MVLKERLTAAASVMRHLNALDIGFTIEIRLRTYGFLVALHREVGDEVVTKSRLVPWSEIEKGDENPLMTAIDELMGSG